VTAVRIKPERNGMISNPIGLEAKSDQLAKEFEDGKSLSLVYRPTHVVMYWHQESGKSHRNRTQEWNMGYGKNILDQTDRKEYKCVGINNIRKNIKSIVCMVIY